MSDGGDIEIDLVANSGGVTIVAKEGFGQQNRLETMIDRLVASVTDSGAIQIHDADGLELRSLFTVDGRISVEAGGTIIATEVVSIN